MLSPATSLGTGRRGSPEVVVPVVVPAQGLARGVFCLRVEIFQEWGLIPKPLLRDMVERIRLGPLAGLAI